MFSHGFRLTNVAKSQIKLGSSLKIYLPKVQDTRNISSMIDEAYTKDPVELDIQTPYGKIAAKFWNPDGKALPILALHGWLDNAGTFDRMAPLIDSNHPFLAIDVPGHGLSSHLPTGTGGYFTDHLVAVQRVVEHFKWEKFIFMGHSMGGGVGMLYTGTFPERVSKLIMLDILRPMSIDPEEQPTTTAKFLTELLPMEQKMLTSKAPFYNYDDLIKKLLISYHGSLNEESIQILLKRGAIKHADGRYTLRYSPILRLPSGLSMTYEQQKAFAENISCDVLVLKSSLGPMYGNNDQTIEVFKVLRKGCKTFQFGIAEGTHHCHLNDPDSVVPAINDFLHDLPQNEERRIEGEKFIAEHL